MSEANPKKEKRIKHGFSKEILGRKCTVFFEYFDERVIKCHLIVGDTLYKDSFEENESFEEAKEFTGISKTNLEHGDVYNREYGESVALYKAIRKYEKFIHNGIKKIMDIRMRLVDEIDKGLSSKLSKVQSQ